MPKPDNILDKRMANALFKEAEIGRAANILLGGGGRAGTAIAQKMMGGLWVGGTAYLTPDTIEFHPNGLNKAFHKDADSLSVSIPLGEVTAIERRFGIATKIIDIETADGILSIRCYNSATFADAIETARAL